MCTIRKVFSSGGPRDRESALKEVATALGYQRLGSAIREVLERDLLTAVRRGILVNEDGQYALLSRTLNGYHRDHLKAMFLAAIGRGWVQREESIRRLARHLGFSRTSSVMQLAGKSLINGLLRSGDLEAEGREMIRRV